jgi:hypothetical protein
MSSKSSGNPSGYGMAGIGKEEGIPNPGIDGPLGPDGDGNETLFGLQGHIVYLYIQLYQIDVETPGAPGGFTSL